MGGDDGGVEVSPKKMGRVVRGQIGRLAASDPGSVW